MSFDLLRVKQKLHYIFLEYLHSNTNRVIHVAGSKGTVVSPSSNTLFWPHENVTILVREEFQKNKKPDFFQSSSKSFFIIFEKLCNTGLNLRLFGQFLIIKVYKNRILILDVKQLIHI